MYFATGTRRVQQEPDCPTDPAGGVPDAAVRCTTKRSGRFFQIMVNSDDVLETFSDFCPAPE